MDKRAGTGNMPLCTILLPAIILFSFFFASGCTQTPASVPYQQIQQPPPDSNGSILWKDTVLPDLQGRGNFSISRFAGKTVIVSIVSASCPGCIVQLTRQLTEIDRLYKQNYGELVVVSLNIDPDNGPEFIATYGDPSGFTGYSAHSPQDMTLDLFHRFGSFSIDPATIPVILVCPDGKALLLPPGVKSAGTLSDTIVREC
jgi:cytochrome oxidase Cu insertion factor (SCO1/SenC/PrrC family)